MSEIKNATKLVTAYVAMRDDLAAKKKVFDEFAKGRKADMQKIADALQKLMDAAGGIESLRTDAGTAFRATKDFVSVEDWNQTLQWVRDTDTLELFNKAVNKTVVKEYMSEHDGATPPGLAYGTSIEIQVRRPTK